MESPVLRELIVLILSVFWYTCRAIAETLIFNRKERCTMPTYEYECKVCKHRFEVFHSISAEPVKECEKCGAEVKRLIGQGSGIIFKGSGFYVNDYKDSGASCDTAPSPGACASCEANNSKK
jgi:putative FmdB family regulatory protein